MIRTEVLQINLNRNWRAQSILEQNMVENRIGICAISEPIKIVGSWFCSRNSLAAICARQEFLAHPCTLVREGTDFVAVRCGPVIFTSVYISPNVDIGTYRTFLDELDDLIDFINGAGMILCGDFNSHAAMWGSRLTNARGILLENWAAGHDLRLINRGTMPTCVRPQGDSIIDLTWVSTDLIRYISGWSVRLDMESLSDHQCITFGIGGPLSRKIGGFPSPYPRWNLNRMFLLNPLSGLVPSV